MLGRKRFSKKRWAVSRILLPALAASFLASWNAMATTAPSTTVAHEQEIARAQSEAETKLKSREVQQPTAAAATSCARLLLCGQVVQASLDPATSCPVSNGSIEDVWAFPGYSEQAVGIAVSSSAFAPEVIVIDPSGNLVGIASAPVGGIASTGVFVFNFALGNYGIGVFTAAGSPANVGDYTIVLVCGGYPCQEDVATMCLQNRRFRLQAGWMNQFNNMLGFSRSLPRTDQAGFFSFGDPSNIELLAKVLDFGTVFKVFYGELTNLKFSLAVTDMLAPISPDTTKTYKNSPGDCGAIDQNAFPSANKASLAKVFPAAKATGTCRSDRNTLCLLSRRFAVTITWMNQFNGASGTGTALGLSDLTGAFSFTDPSNLELLFKLIDFGDRVAVFYGTLSNLQYTATVTDTLTGQAKTYVNAPGNYCGGLDNTAFPP
jgi:hypothetical protein